MGVEAVVGHSGLILLFVVLPLVSLAVAVGVLARAPWSFGARVAVAVTGLAIGFTPIVWLIVVLSQWPAGD